MTQNFPTLQIEGFKAFHGKTRIKLRPITLFYGRNHSGKSSLLRLMPLLGDCMAEGVSGFAEKSASLRGATFKEVCWLGPSPNTTLYFTLINENDPRMPEYYMAIANSDEERPLHNVISLSWKDNPKLIASWGRTVEQTPTVLRSNYEGSYNGQPWSGELYFSSIFPANPPDGAAQEILDSVKLCMAPLARIQWLQANRLFEPSTSPTSGSKTLCCANDGSDLPTIFRSDSAISGNVSEWLSGQRHLGSEVRIQKDVSGAWRFEIKASSVSEFLPLHLAGEGARSLLPVLFCASWAETGRAGAPTALAIEEPESHLHPDLQVALLKRLLQTAKSVPVLLETHSVYVLRGVQLAVAEGSLEPSDVGLYWLDKNEAGEATATEIIVKPDATLENWQPGEFEQEQELARSILDARWRRPGSGQ